MNKSLIVSTLLALTLATGPALADQCVLDYEAYVIRPALPDEAATIDEQSAAGADWFVNGDRLKLFDHTYEKSGSAQVVAPAQIEFYAFVGSVPFFMDAGSGADIPPKLYASVDPLSCEVQPYALLPE